MEFPDLGEHCAVSSCRLLDFLPVRCSGCQKVFCKDHYCFDCHSCPIGNSRERQVPICPLCGVPVPIGPNESADIKVGQHIDTACRSQPATVLKGKIFKNACSVPKCKKKELLPFRCERCQMNFCISHRNEMDHECKGLRPGPAQARRSSVNAAVRRAMAMRISAASAVENNPRESPVIAISKAQQVEEDRQLALALAASYDAEAADEQRRQIRQREFQQNQRMHQNQQNSTSRTSNNGCGLS